MDQKNKQKSRRKYDAQFKEAALRQVANGQSVSSVAEVSWHERSTFVPMAEGGPVSVEPRGSGRRDRDTAQTNKAVRRRTGYPKKSLSHFQPTDKRMIYKFITDQSSDYPVDLLCKMMEISRSAYYAYHKGDTFTITDERVMLESEVTKVFNVHRKRYGSRRIKHELHRQGIPIGRDKVRGLMKSQMTLGLHL